MGNSFRNPSSKASASPSWAPATERNAGVLGARFSSTARPARGFQKCSRTRRPSWMTSLWLNRAPPACQSRSGETIHEYRLRPVRPPEHGFVGHLRPWAANRKDLPGFVVLQSGAARTTRRRDPLGERVSCPRPIRECLCAARVIRSWTSPSPPGVTTARKRGHSRRHPRSEPQPPRRTGDPEISTRISAYEMACRMQSSAPELINLSTESEATLKLYGVDKDSPSFARNCLLARRLVERGVRFVQLYHTNWDRPRRPRRESPGRLRKGLPRSGPGPGRLDQGSEGARAPEGHARRLGGEFGRTPMGENRDTTGRNHHIDAFTMWLAGGGVKAGACHRRNRRTRASIPSLTVSTSTISNATILHLLGLEHIKLTFRFSRP